MTQTRVKLPDRRVSYSTMTNPPQPSFDLRVVTAEQVHPHEEVDRARVERLMGRLESSEVLKNPPVVTRSPEGGYVLLDGATRTEALKNLGFSELVVQVVGSDFLELGTWHHVVRGVPSASLREWWEETQGLQILTHREPSLGLVVATIFLTEGPVLWAYPSEPSERYRALSQLVSVYRDDPAMISRSRDAGLSSLIGRYPDMGALVQFTPISLEDVFVAVETGHRFPAGITRFEISGRVLRLNAPLKLLSSDDSQKQKQNKLDALLNERAKAGRIRLYAEPTFVLDE